MPACICLMTLSGATATDPKLSLEKFSGSAKSGKKDYARISTAEAGSADPVVAKIPIEAAPAVVAVIVPQAAEPQTQAALPDIVPLPPVPRPVVQRTHQEICDSLTAAAQTNNLPVHFFISLLFQESGFNPAEVSSAGAQGIAQFMPETAADMGLQNPFDPVQAIPASARLLRNLVAQFGNLGLAAAAYNAGPKRVQDWLAKLSSKTAEKKTAKKTKAKSVLPEETQGYVMTITGHPVETWTTASAALPGQRLPRHAPCQEAAGLYAWSGPTTIPLPQPSPLTRLAAAPSAKTKAANSDIKPAIQQLAARKHANDKLKLEKVAQR
jgi:soluble lytic murein transglycosylase-like protein